MPKRSDIKRILLIGSGPIVIGQACEFDYSGTQACKALRQEGYEVVLINSNPATIMTDPEMADVTYIEPLTSEILEMIIKRERPDALLPTMGGQTALNLSVELAEKRILEKYNVKLIGANIEAIKKAEDRDLFRKAMESIGLEIPKSSAVNSIAEGMKAIDYVGFPAIFRPAFTLGGAGGGVAYNHEEYKELLEKAIDLSPINQVLIEESVIGWKEFELEVMRDNADNVVIICSIENFDPMGVHTGDSITIAPAQTLTDKEYQMMRDASIAIIREIGVDTGGSNIQFAINPRNGRLMVIEMNPRVSRSSALASKATGFPIAKMAAKLAVGLRLYEIPNDITRETPASFEPMIDYVVTKIPRFTFEKFVETEPVLTTQMKSVGEVMAIGRTFKESLHKAIRSLETDVYGLGYHQSDENVLESKMRIPTPERLWYIAEALRREMKLEKIYELTGIDPWFLNNIKEIIDMEEQIRGKITEDRGQKSEDRKQKTEDGRSDPQRRHASGSQKTEDRYMRGEIIRRAKEYGFSDKRIAELLNSDEIHIRNIRKEYDIYPVYKMVDTCAAEFEAYTPYLYSTYERPYYKLKDKKTRSLEDEKIRTDKPLDFSISQLPDCKAKTECESRPSSHKKVVILGSGPNRIGQGIEFDYCCVHAVFALKEIGYETIMVNCNPETVSTDYDTSDKLYFEPLTIEDVINIIEKERPEGVIVQFGGQTPLKLAVPLEKEGIKIFGTTPDSIDRAEDRKRFRDLLEKLNLKQTRNDTAMSTTEASSAAKKIGYPVMVRPSYVLGGRAMEIVYDEESLISYMAHAVKVSPKHPVLIDKYLEDAIEIDVDAVSDGEVVVIGGVMEHIEEAGIHSGDSACSLPPHSLSHQVIERIKVQTRSLAKELGVVGLMNVQFAVKDNEIYILEVNPRASRTIPYVSKATGITLAKIAAKLMTGMTLNEIGFIEERNIDYVAVKESVFPFERFPGVDTILGPEMKSTGEVMGIDSNFGIAYAKAQSSSFNRIPLSGKIIISVRDEDKYAIPDIARSLLENNFTVIATKGTAKYLKDKGFDVETVNKVTEGRPHIVDMIKNEEISFIINTTQGAQAKKDSRSIRTTALQYKVPYTTTISAAKAAVKAIEMLKLKGFGVKPIQEYHSNSI